MQDAFGQELRVGDYVGYVTGGRYQDSVKGRIVKFGKSRFQIEVTSHNSYTNLNGKTLWCEPHRATRTLESFDE